MHALIVAAAAGDKTNNFLIPNGTFFFELLLFLVVLWVLAKKIVPPINNAIEKRQATIRQQFEEAEQTKARLEATEKEYKEALAETRRESTRLREEAQAERAQIIEEARSEATRRAEEILEANRDRLATERHQILLSLRNEIGELAVTLSEKIVHDSLRDDERQRKLVDDFISGVGSGVEAGSRLESAGSERSQ
jgi:F-type H+-transporting ATPase subunit b